MVGVGNVLRSDDGIGCRLVERLAARAPSPSRITLVDAGGGLENHLGRILRERPEAVLIVDAVELGRRPGDYELLDPEDLDGEASGTHDLSLRTLAEHLRRELPAVDVKILAVQPASTAMGEGLSPDVVAALSAIEMQIGGVL